MANIVNRLQIVDGNQRVIKVANTQVSEVMQLCCAARGTREFVFLRFTFLDGSMKFYLNEMSMGGQLQEVDNDEEFEEVMAFIDFYMKNIQAVS